MSVAFENKFINVPRRAVVLSIIFHILAPFAFLMVQVMEEKGMPFLPAKKKSALLEAKQSFIQVDVVGLPDELPTQRPSVDTSEPIVDKPAKAANPTQADEKLMADPETRTAKTAEKQKAKQDKEFADKTAREKRVSEEQSKALKRLEAEAAREAALKSIGDRPGKSGRQRISGNLLSKGNALTGAIGTSKDQYTSIVLQSIKERFNIFPWQKARKLICVVHIELVPTGRVRSKKVLKRSADPLFDSAVLHAIDMAQPLPIPQDLSIIQNGITVEFRPE